MRLKLLGCIPPLLLFAGIAYGAAPTKNVLLIIADDLGIDSLSGFNNNPDASLPPTPTIDSLRARGIQFTRFYAYSTCSPTRAAIMTGRYAFRTGVLAPVTATEYDLKSNEFTLPEALTAAGVLGNRTACIGKWHLGTDASSPNTIGGWPHFSGCLGGGLNDYWNWQKTVDGMTTNHYSVYATTDNVNDALTWINSQGTNNWFLWLAFNAPHVPFHKPPDDLHDYDSLSTNAADIAANPRPYFEAMVQAMDTEMGRLLDGVDLQTTTVFFMGDNGTLGQIIQPPFGSSHGKGSIYEGGVRVPMIVAGAAVSNSLTNTVCDTPLDAVDLYATILDCFEVSATNVVPPEFVLDSQSFLPILRDESYLRNPEQVMSEINSNAGPSAIPSRMIVEGDYKLIEQLSGTQEFYNVNLGIAEHNNLLDGSLTSTQQAVFDRLQSLLPGYQNVPVIHGIGIENGGTIQVNIGWFANNGFTLWRSSDLRSNIWESVPGQQFEDDGSATLRLRDPAPLAGSGFYKVSTP